MQSKCNATLCVWVCGYSRLRFHCTKGGKYKGRRAQQKTAWKDNRGLEGWSHAESSRPSSLWSHQHCQPIESSHIVACSMRYTIFEKEKAQIFIKCINERRRGNLQRMRQARLLGILDRISFPLQVQLHVFYFLNGKYNYMLISLFQIG